MLDMEKLDREIAYITKLLAEIELAIEVEERHDIKSALRSAAWELRAARVWLKDIRKERS